MNKQKNKKAFTLVELIVVITILAILATIAFLSFQSYTKNARDGNRITTLNNIDKGLNIYKTQKGKYPMPDNINGTGTLNGKELIYVGEIGKNIQRLINLNSLPKDPLTNDEFFYGISKDAENYQLAAIYETELSQNAVTSTYADSGYKAKVLGNYEGILKYNSGGICISNIPSLLFATGGEIDLKNENVGFIVNKGENLPYKSLKSKAILKPTTDILKMISNTGSVTTECKTEEEWKEAFLEEQKKQELETKFGYEIDKTGKQIFGDKYFKEIKKEEGLSLSTDLYSLSDDELKKIFTSKNVFTNNWENTSLCNVSSMNIDETTFHPGTFNQDLIFTGNTIYKIPAGEYIFSKANVDEYYFTKYGSNCIGFIGEGENKTIIKNADSGDSIFLVDGGNNIILSGFSINRDDPIDRITGIHIKETSNNTTLTNIKVENQDNGIYIDGNATLGFINTKNNQNGIFHTKGNLIIKDSSFNNNSGIGIYSVGGNLTIKNTTANGNSNNGFNNHGGNNHLIENSHFDNNSWIGIYSTSGNLTIKNTTANGNSNNGFNNHGGNNHIIENSHFDNNSGMGIYSTSGNLTIKNSTANGNSNNGFNASGGDNHIIENSEFNNNKENGIYHSSSSSSIDIDGTTFNGNLKDGLLFQGSVRSSVKNSTFDGNTENGLSGYGPIDIENITLSNNKKSGIVVYSSNNTINTVTSSNNLNNDSQYGGFVLYGSNNIISSISSHDNESSGFIIYGSNNQINNLNSSNNKKNGLIISGGTNTINTLDANNNTLHGVHINSTWATNNIINSYEGGTILNEGGTTNIVYAR